LVISGESRSGLLRARPGDDACEVVESGAPAPLSTAHHRLDDDEHLVSLLHHYRGHYLGFASMGDPEMLRVGLRNAADGLPQSDAR